MRDRRLGQGPVSAEVLDAVLREHDTGGGAHPCEACGFTPTRHRPLCDSLAVAVSVLYPPHRGSADLEAAPCPTLPRVARRRGPHPNPTAAIRPLTEGGSMPDTTLTESCAAGCGRPVVLAEPHITIVTTVQREQEGAVEIIDEEPISYLHKTCGRPYADAAGADPALVGGRHE